MKRILCMILCVICFLYGCSVSSERIKDPVHFYYLKNTLEYRSHDGVIAREEREASGHRENLSYLLALYRIGPSSEELRLPFPEGTAILMMEQTEKEIKLALGSNASTMSDAEFSLACACLTLTCTELTNVERVTVTNGQQSITMTRESITLLDTSMTEETEDTK